jgi:hypothetical protein
MRIVCIGGKTVRMGLSTSMSGGKFIRYNINVCSLLTLRLDVVPYSFYYKTMYAYSMHCSLEF